VLVTPAYNEERHITEILRWVTGQMLLPRLWVIVSDGSTDKTGEIVRDWASRKVLHFGLVGAGAGGPLKARFKWGRMNFHLGYHPLFQLARSVYRVGERPFLLGSLAELLGFTVGKTQGRRPSVDGELVRCLRREQLTKLRNLLSARR
jgi:glycosyltransferase involved in cell wall biosynthesis